MNNYEFKDKVVLITGANRGIGEAYVHTLLKVGVRKVYAAVRDLENLNLLQQQYPDKLEPILMDVTNSKDINALKEKITSLDILVNNAGIAHSCGFTSDNSLDNARLEMEVNYFGPMQIIQAVLPKLKQSKQALIINVSSIAGISNLSIAATYSATKAAMHSLTQGLRAELSADDIRVIGIYPGPIDTRMAEGFEMEKPKPEQVAVETIEAVAKQEINVFPDDFSKEMYRLFLKHPNQLEHYFSEMM